MKIRLKAKSFLQVYRNRFVGVFAILLMIACQQKETSNGDASSSADSHRKAVEQKKAPETKTTPDSRSIEQLLRDARRYVKAENYQEARFAAQKVFRKDSSVAEAYEIYGNIYYAINNTEKAKNQWQRCAKLDEQNIECRLNLAQLWIALNLTKKALEPLNTIIDKHPNEARAYFYKGMVYRNGVKDTNRALQYFQKAVDLKQDYYEALDLLAVTLANKGDTMAEYYYRRLIDIQPNNAETYYKLGVYYMERNQINRALEAYTQATQINPRHADSYYNMGYMMIELREFSDAKKYFTQSINAQGKNYKAYYGRGYAREMLGDVMNAEKDYKQVLEWVPNYPPARNGLQRLKNIEEQSKQLR